MGNRIKPVCRECTDRYVGCHGTCKKYIDAKAEYDLKISEISKIVSARKEADDYKNRRIEIRLRKERGHKR